MQLVALRKANLEGQGHGAWRLANIAWNPMADVVRHSHRSFTTYISLFFTTHINSSTHHK
jgi:hypothetical protein